MSKRVAFLVAFAMTLALLVGCGSSSSSSAKPGNASVSSGSTSSPSNSPASTTDSSSKETVHKVTADEYAQIKEGMTYEEVVKIIGEEGEEISSSEVAGIKTVMYQWVNWDGSNMNAIFQDGKLVAKAQFGLK